MRIISQNGLYDFPYEKCFIYINKEKIMASSIGEPNLYHTMAIFSTQEKAKKSMQLLHESYIVHENFKKIDAELQLKMIETVEKETGLKYGGIFRFPKEEDL